MNNKNNKIYFIIGIQVLALDHRLLTISSRTRSALFTITHNVHMLNEETALRLLHIFHRTANICPYPCDDPGRNCSLAPPPPPCPGCLSCCTTGFLSWPFFARRLRFTATRCTSSRFLCTFLLRLPCAAADPAGFFFPVSTCSSSKNCCRLEYSFFLCILCLVRASNAA